MNPFFIVLSVLLLSIPAHAETLSEWLEARAQSEALRDEAPQAQEPAWQLREEQNSQTSIFRRDMEEDSSSADIFRSDRASLYDTRTGTVTGSVDGEPVKLYQNRVGTISGSIGEDRVTLHETRSGGLSGSIGEERVQLHENRLGGLSGSIGGRPVSCYTNRIGRTDCY